MAGKRHSSSLSNYDCFTTTHTAVHLSIDFPQRILHGRVRLHIQAVAGKAAYEIVLDTNSVDIDNVQVDGCQCSWQLRPSTGPLGAPLHLRVDRHLREFVIDVSPPECPKNYTNLTAGHQDHHYLHCPGLADAYPVQDGASVYV